MVAIVNCDVPEPLSEGGLKDVVAPFGNPETFRFVVPENPFVAATVNE